MSVKDKILHTPFMAFPDRSLRGLVTTVAAFFVIFGGIVPFIPQYLQIKKSNNAEGFSTFVCLTLLVANILRIWFWFGHPFEMPLFIQSIVMICTMLVMVNICTSVKNRSELIPDPKPKSFTDSSTSATHLNADGTHLEERRHSNSNSANNVALKSGPRLIEQKRRFRDFKLAHFWKWTDFESYLQCLGVISLVTGVITYLLLDSAIYIETLGFMALFCEAMLGAPQFYRNHLNKSTQGMSLPMVLSWTLGDVVKTGYFIMRVSPAQFYICGGMQICLDIGILLQVYSYKGRGPALTVKKAAIQ